MRLRQLVLVTKEIDSLTEKICDLFELRTTFNDPELIHFGLENRIIPVGDTFLEIVSPVKENTSAERFLSKRKGDSGYMVIVDVNDFENEKKRLKENKFKVIWHEKRYVHGIYAQALHLHPKQIGGAILSLDSMVPNSAWLWAGTDWRKDVNQSLVKTIKGVVLQSPIPETLCAKWEIALGKKRAEGENLSICLNKSEIKFVKDKDLNGEGINAFIISTNKLKKINTRAEKRGFIKDSRIQLGGVCFLLSTIL